MKKDLRIVSCFMKTSLFLDQNGSQMLRKDRMGIPFIIY
ncbi:hypothetical protein ATPR_0303 [Acetobacter tropicalis NBRC 101654]|uniref:Uncharacterized protein n=1 Tax=Acetobacter tropicalis NBRC 101654 TaxID=749388 RepID=F7VAA4_9PROT|nr:hypothetical protein ATPR_0303 [Acetobacter tropicalis NBRC 101654]